MRIERIPSKDRRLGRHVVHDPRSLDFAHPVTVDTSTWNDVLIRIVDPYPNPAQTKGNCTTCAEAMLLNTHGNRKPGQILGMAWADEAYVWETHHDNFDGAYPPDDTGSSGLWAAKTAVHLGVGGTYNWIINGADGVVTQLQKGRTVAVGTKWYEDMFTLGPRKVIEPTGALVGGHEYVYRGYDEYHDELIGRCWWGPDFRDFRIKRSHADDLLADHGDAHTQDIAADIA